MNISKVSYSLIGAVMTAGILTGCDDTKYIDNAKMQAVQYLNGEELLKAERFASMQMNSDKYNGEAIVYWDSLLSEVKINDAYNKGQELVRDSINGVLRRKTNFKIPLDTIIKSYNVIDDAKHEYAKYTTAHEYIKARAGAPSGTHIGYNDLVGSTHYWNLITIAGKQKEAYKNGMADARNELIKK